MIKWFLFKDPKTRRKSFTVTMMVYSFVAMTACQVLLMTRQLTDIKVGFLSFMIWATTLALYHQKRVKVDLSGVEVSACPEVDFPTVSK
ncbi:MAG TPA: hypothetical protein VFW62_02640 [bacterium]|nr:hypothetical protein [bacterium]